jgi:hypothetical protein
MITRAWRAVAVTLAVLLGTSGLGSLIYSPPAQGAAPYYSPSANEGSIYRLYRAYFLRDPDTAGFMYWYLQVSVGTSLDQVSDLFAESSEFRTRYGNPDNFAFVELIYQNVLGRDPDAQGRDYWVGRLDAGLSRGRVMRFFSESGEYQRETATGVPSGWRAGSNARTLLAALPVADEPPRLGYDRDLFRHWDDADRDGCDTRCEVLAAEKRSDGTWFSWWDAKLVSVSGFLDIDHVVDLAEAWDSGASVWNEAQRDAFADSRLNLLAVGQKVNASKGDQDASEWTPPRAKSNCLFAEITITTKYRWSLSVDAAEKSALGALLDGCARATSNPPPVTGPPKPRPTVILYGDSLSMETVKFFRWFTWQGGHRAVTVVWGGTAPCDWFSHMRSDRYEHRPAAVVIQFSGAAITPCMVGRDVYEAYRKDARTATQIFIDAGVPVVWVSTPLPEDPDSVVAGINLIEQEAATELGATYVDAGAAVLDDGRYSRTLPCLAHETSSYGCTGGRIVVRSPDGAHLCPTQKNFPCPMYSSGALRYGDAQADAALRRVGVRSR